MSSAVEPGERDVHRCEQMHTYILGVKRTLKFGFELTHVLTNELERMFSPDFQV